MQILYSIVYAHQRDAQQATQRQPHTERQAGRGRRTLPVSRGLGGKIAYPATTLLLVMVQGDIQTSDFALKAPQAFGAFAREGSTMPRPLSRHLTREGAVQAPELAY